MVEIRVGQQTDNRVTLTHASALHAHIQEAIASGQGICFVPAHKGRFFCAGYDLGDLIRRSDNEVEQCFVEFLQIARTLFHAPVPISVVADGHAVGFGAMLCLAADHACMHSSGKFRFPEILLGLSLFDDIVSLIRYRAAPAVAQHLLCQAASLSAGQALKHGLINHVYDDEAGLQACLDRRDSEKPGDAFGQMKRLCRSGFVDGNQTAQVKTFMTSWTRSDTQARIRQLVDSDK